MNAAKADSIKNQKNVSITTKAEENSDDYASDLFANNVKNQTEEGYKEIYTKEDLLSISNYLDDIDENNDKLKAKTK